MKLNGQIFYFRVDASVRIGTGHVNRCLTLARVLKREGARCFFISRLLNGNLNELIKECGHVVLNLPPPDLDLHHVNENIPHDSWLEVAWLDDAIQTNNILPKIPVNVIIDHYALGKKWQSKAVSKIHRCIVIDDLNDREIDCDIYINSSIKSAALTEEKISTKKQLLGSKYVIMSEGFQKKQKTSIHRRKKRSGSLRDGKLLICLGGMDVENLSLKILKGITCDNFFDNWAIEIVLSRSAPHIHEINNYLQINKLNCKLLLSVDNMPDLMAEADISIGGAGATAWERCLLGLPSIVVIMAQNQLGIANYLVDKGSIILSSSDNVEILAHVKKIATYGAKRLQITKNSLRVCDGKGISRILNEIQKIIPNDPL